jgi:hypothetical protein
MNFQSPSPALGEGFRVRAQNWDAPVELSLMLYCIGHLLNDRHRLNANSTDPLQQINDLFFVVSEFVGVEEFGDRGATTTY